MFYHMSVLDDCAIARSFDGVRAMHDATECGVWGGLFEMARAGEYGLRIRRDSIPIAPVAERTAELFDFDPFCAISEGTLIAVVEARQADALVRALHDGGIESAVCGEVVPETEGLKIIAGDTASPLEHPRVDPYWAIAARLSR